MNENFPRVEVFIGGMRPEWNFSPFPYMHQIERRGEDNGRTHYSAQR
jgi:hypothetical protein